MFYKRKLILRGLEKLAKGTKDGLLSGTLRESRDLLLQVFYKGALIARTRLSRGAGEVEETYMIRQQLHLNEKDFDDLVMCPMSPEDYLSKMAQKGKVDL